jgi:hypothetical protein
LNEPDIDDMITDINRKTCLEVSKGPEEARIIQGHFSSVWAAMHSSDAGMCSVSRSQFNATYLDLLSAYVASSPSPVASSSSSIRSAVSVSNGTFGEARDVLLQFINRPRARCIDFKARTNAGRGTTVLHEGRPLVFMA